MDPYRSLDRKGSKMGGICITRMAQLMKVLAPSLMTHFVTVEYTRWDGGSSVLGPP